MFKLDSRNFEEAPPVVSIQPKETANEIQSRRNLLLLLPPRMLITSEKTTGILDLQLQKGVGGRGISLNFIPVAALTESVEIKLWLSSLNLKDYYLLRSLSLSHYSVFSSSRARDREREGERRERQGHLVGSNRRSMTVPVSKDVTGYVQGTTD